MHWNLRKMRQISRSAKRVCGPRRMKQCQRKGLHSIEKRFLQLHFVPSAHLLSPGPQVTPQLSSVTRSKGFSACQVEMLFALYLPQPDGQRILGMLSASELGEVWCGRRRADTVSLAHHEWVFIRVMRSNTCCGVAEHHHPHDEKGLEVLE